LRSSLDRILVLAWLLYRRSRVLAASTAGRNPLIPLSAMIPLSQEVRAIRALVCARKRTVRLVKAEPDRNLWETSLGSLWAPPGADVAYMRTITLEMLAGVYPLDSIAPGGVAIDAGANIGCFSRYALSRGLSRIIAFEPSPETVECLRANVPEAEIIHAGAWSSRTTLSFSTAVKTNPGAHHICEGGNGDTTIDVTTIDDVVAELNLSRVDYIKMDIEGAEVQALRGATGTINRFRPQLAIATEHTEDLIANTKAVIQVIRQIDPSYRYVVTEAQFARDYTGAFTLIPYTLHFHHMAGTAGSQ
jgi:FkbM family methyltransferase